MNSIRESGERLVDAWLNLSSTIWNKRIVSEMPFNETYVCNLLKRQIELEPDIKLTATELCSKTGLFKSQMNRILNSMEANGYIRRVRSKEDKRFVYIELSEKGLKVYEKTHEEVMILVDSLIEKVGNKTEETAETLNSIANEFRKLTAVDKPKN
ncbi:MAG: MarR family transcriptional regulator [Candidatus Metalachnospira sp.]|nr:MarR family transcriptional regulator [Candidatus Metalachnospira sp.]